MLKKEEQLVKEQELVSVIIPTYKRSINLTRAINSVINQDYKNIEVIVVDDNGKGSDYQLETENRIKEYIENKKVIYIVRDLNGGGGQARNSGLNEASGKIITFLDDDDVYKKDKISKQVEHLNEGNDIVLCSMVVVNESGNSFYPEWSKAKGKNLNDFLINGNAYTPMIMFRRRLFEAGGCFEKVKMLQDHIFVLNLLKISKNINSFKYIGFEHHIHNEERVSKNIDVNCFLNKQDKEIGLTNDEKVIAKLKRKHIKELALVYSRKNCYFMSLKYCLKFICGISSAKELVEGIKLSIRVIAGNKIFNFINGFREVLLK